MRVAHQPLLEVVAQAGTPWTSTGEARRYLTRGTNVDALLASAVQAGHVEVAHDDAPDYSYLAGDFRLTGSGRVYV